MTSGSSTPPKAPAAQEKPPHPRRKLKPGQLASGAAIALVIVFAVLNTDRVKVDWIVATGHTPLIVVIVVSFLLGGLGGAVFWRRRTVKRGKG